MKTIRHDAALAIRHTGIADHLARADRILDRLHRISRHPLLLRRMIAEQPRDGIAKPDLLPRGQRRRGSDVQLHPLDPSLRDRTVVDVYCPDLDHAVVVIDHRQHRHLVPA